jgi:hypothetical protein
MAESSNIFKRIPRGIQRRLRNRMPGWRVAARRCLGLPPLKQVVICGYPRGGTSMLYNMMSATLKGFECDQFENSCLQYVDRYGSYLSKNPMDVLDIEELTRKNVLRKDLCIIVVLRDLRDVVTSVHPNAPDRYFQGYEGGWSPQGGYGEYKLVATQRSIKTLFHAIESLRSLKGARFVFVKYEDLVENPDRQQQILREQFDLKFSGPFSKFHEHPEKHAYRYEGEHAPADPSLVRESSAVDRSRSGKWARPEHRQRILEQFGQYPEMLDMLIHYGYEKDREWFSRFQRSEVPSQQGSTPSAG